MEKVLRIIGQNGGGGARVHIFQLNEYLESRGHRTTTLIPPPGFDDPMTSATRVPFRYIHYSNAFEAFAKLWKYSSGVTYVHSHLRNATVLASLLPRADIPHVVTIHTPVLGQKSSYKEKAFSYLVRKALKRAAGVIFISQYIRDLTYAQFGGSLEIENERVIYNGSTHLSDQLRSVSDKTRICLVGELTDRKGLADFVELIRLCGLSDSARKLEFNVYGTGPWAERLQHLGNDYSFLKMHGYEANAKKIYCENDINLMLGRTEAFGRTITEAKSFGLPTIAFRAGAFPELINHTLDGYLEENIEAIFSRILDIVGKPFLRDGLASAAKQDFAARFSSSVFAKNTQEFIEISLCKWRTGAQHGRKG